jgi:hypothetical protein
MIAMPDANSAIGAMARVVRISSAVRRLREGPIADQALE